MKVKLIIISIILLLVMVFVSGCIPFMEKIGLISPTDEEQLSPEKASPDGLVKVLIGFRKKPGAAQQAMVRGVGGKIKYTYSIVDAIAASIPEKAIEALQKNPNVRYVEADGIVYALDAELENSWGVERIGAGIVHLDGNKGAGVKVAIIDSGVDYNHVDLTANFDTALLGYDFVNDDDDPMDDAGHGTHVAGTVAAEDNGEGVVGVAPEAALYALKVLDETGRGYVSNIVAAIEWAIDPDGIPKTDDSMDIINMSLGGGAHYTLEDVCQAAYDAGLLLVAAAGNNGNPPGKGDNIIYPAAYESVIAVAATDKSDKRARWSSTGPYLELSAPGVAINSTLLGGGYGEKMGTSMASPHVAGVAALVWAANPGWLKGIVRDQLQDTADDLGATDWDPLYGHGLVNAVDAVGMTSADDLLGPVTSGVVADPNPTNGATSVTLMADVSDATTGNSNIVAAEYFVDTVEDNGTGIPMIALDDAFNSPTEEVTAIIDIDIDVSAWAVGEYTLYVHGLDSEDNWGETESVVLDVTEAPSDTTMYVSNIDMSISKIAEAGPNTFYTAIATVKIVDTDDAAVEGATVSGHWSDATTDTDSGVTNADGQVSLESNKVKNPTSGVTKFTFTVDNVEKTGWTYNPKDNEETSNSKTYN